MFYVSKIFCSPPDRFQTPLQEKAYQALSDLGLSFERVDTDEAIAMEDCVRIEERLHMKMVKTLFLCSRRQTAFYLFVTAGDKPFRSKEFSAALGVARVSFAPSACMEQMLGTRIGAATVFSALLDTARDVQLVFDKAVLSEEWYGCSDGTTTGYLKIKTSDITDRLLPYAKHSYAVAEV